MSLKLEEKYPISVLYVEDDDSLRVLTETKLKRLVEKIYLAEDGVVGLKKFEEHKPDVVITDIQMPHMDGLEMIKHIRAKDSFTNIIITTAFDDTETLVLAVELGIDNYLIKPINPAIFAKTLKKCSDNIYAQKSLFRSKQYYNAIDKSFIISKYDPDGNFTYVNENFEKLYGYTKDEIVGKPYDYLLIEKKNASKEKLLKEISKNGFWCEIIRSRKKSGSVVVSDISIFPIHDDFGEIKEYMALRSDITELERLREKQLMEEKKLLRERQKIETLQEVNQAKDSFLVIFTHELKTPLNAIINFSEYVWQKIKSRDFKNPEKLEELLNGVKRNAATMLDMVSNLLDIAKLKAKRIEPIRSIFKAETIISDVISASLESLVVVSQKSTILNVDETIYINSDMMMFRQIVSNLYSNAIKYGGENIYISLIKSGNGFEFVIEDDGAGIKEKGKVFELYYQEGGMLQRDSKGTGIGLYLVKLLCDELGFQIKLTNSEHGGAKFILNGEL